MSNLETDDNVTQTESISSPQLQNVRIRQYFAKTTLNSTDALTIRIFNNRTFTIIFFL